MYREKKLCLLLSVISGVIIAGDQSKKPDMREKRQYHQLSQHDSSLAGIQLTEQTVSPRQLTGLNNDVPAAALTAIDLAKSLERQLAPVWQQQEKELTEKDRKNARALKRAQCCRCASLCPLITSMLGLCVGFGYGITYLPTYLGKRFNAC